MRHMRRTVYVLHSALAPNAIADALRRSIDEKHWMLFSLSGYRGYRPLIGEISENKFTVQKRRYSRNDFAGHLFAQYWPEAGGTRIEAYFDPPAWARYFMRVWLAGAVLIGMPIFVTTVLDVITGSHRMSGDRWVGLVVPPALILYGTVIPRIGRLLGKGDRQFILKHIQNTVAARIEERQSNAESSAQDSC
jgi:hypothetical protein